MTHWRVFLSVLDEKKILTSDMSSILYRKKTRSVNSCVPQNERNYPLNNVMRFIRSDDRYNAREKKNVQRYLWSNEQWDDVTDIDILVLLTLRITKDCIHYPLVAMEYFSFVCSNEHFRKFLFWFLTKLIRWFSYFQWIWLN